MDYIKAHGQTSSSLTLTPEDEKWQTVFVFTFLLETMREKVTSNTKYLVMLCYKAD